MDYEESVAAAISRIRELNLVGAKDISEWEQVIQDYFLGNRQPLSEEDDSDDSESDVDVIPDLDNGTNVGFVPVCDHDTDYFQEVTSLDTDIATVVTTEEVDQVMESLEVDDSDYDKEMDKILKFMCKCGQRRKENTSQESCIKKLDPDFVYKSRYMIAALTLEEKEMFIMGQLFCNGRRGDLTTDNKRIPTKRKRPRTHYSVDSVQICRESFLFIHGIGKDRLDAIQQHMRENGIMTRANRRGQQKNKRFLQHEDIRQVVTFITNYAEDHAVVLPGRHPNQKSFGGKLLPSHVTKASVWRDYSKAMMPTEQRAVQLSTFKDIWSKLLPHITSTKPMADLCWECQKNNYQVYKSANQPEAVKCAKLKKQEQHLQLVGSEMEVYNSMIKASKDMCASLKLSLGGRVQPASKSMKMHYSFDFAQQVHYPSDPLQPGPMYFLTPRKCGLFGVCCEGIPQQVNYLVDEGMSSSKGSNAVISYLHHFFSDHGLGETEVHLHCDNCSGQNKNKFMLWYCAWRTLHKLHHRLDLHFLIAGHTEFSPDWCFGLIKQCFRKTRVNTLAEIAAVVQDSTVKGTNIPQLVGKEDGTVVALTYDWQQHLSPFFRPLPQMQQYQHFSFDAKDPGVVVAKMSFGGKETRFQLLRDIHALPPGDGLPVLPPPGLDSARQSYLFHKIRQFCDDNGKDITCPAPQPGRGGAK